MTDTNKKHTKPTTNFTTCNEFTIERLLSDLNKVYVTNENDKSNSDKQGLGQYEKCDHSNKNEMSTFFEVLKYTIPKSWIFTNKTHNTSIKTCEVVKHEVGTPNKCYKRTQKSQINIPLSFQTCTEFDILPINKTIKNYENNIYQEYLKFNSCLTTDILRFIFEFNGMDFIYMIITKNLIYSEIMRRFDIHSYFIFTNLFDAVLYMKKTMYECDLFMIQLNRRYNTTSFSSKKLNEYIGYSFNNTKTKTIILFPRNLYMLSNYDLDTNKVLIMEHDKSTENFTIRMENKIKKKKNKKKPNCVQLRKTHNHNKIRISNWIFI